MALLGKATDADWGLRIAEDNPKSEIKKYAQPDLRVVVFKMADHEYVIDVAMVQEIIRPTDPAADPRTGLMHVDGAPECIEGVVKRRGRIVPVVDLRKHLGLGVSPPTAETCVIIARLPVGPVGFLVDSASELAWVKTHDFEVPSPVMAGVDGKLCSDYLQGMAHLGDRLLVMLDLERLLTPGEQRELGELDAYDQAAVSQRETRGHGRRPAPAQGTLETLFSGEVDAEAAEAEQERARADPSTGSGHRLRSLVTFELSGELYGVPVTDVAEIREPPAIMPLPNVEPHVLGLINLRGVVLPVIDLRRKFGFNGFVVATSVVSSASTTTEVVTTGHRDNRLIVLKGPGYPVALWVDSVRGLARLPQADFQPAPPGVARIDPEYYDQVVMLDGRMLIELDVQRLLADTGCET